MSPLVEEGSRQHAIRFRRIMVHMRNYIYLYLVIVASAALVIGACAEWDPRAGTTPTPEPTLSPTSAPTIATRQAPTTSPTSSDPDEVPITPPSATSAQPTAIATPVPPPTVVANHTPLPTATPTPTPTPPINVIYVDPENGADDNDGSSKEPLETIQRALEMVEPGWHIRLRSGIYGQELETVTAGTPDAPIVIEPDGDAKPILDGDLRLDAPVILHSYYVIRGLEIRNFDHEVNLQGVEGVVLEGNHIHHFNGQCVHVWTFSVRNVVRKNEVHDCGLERNGEGIYVGTASDQLYKVGGQLDESTENLIEDNLLYNVSEGIDVKPGSSNTTIINNEIYNARSPGSGGINVRSDENYIANNLSYNNEGAGFRIGQDSGGVNNVLRGNIASNNEFGGYKFIKAPQDVDCTNTGVGNEEGRLYYFMDDVAEFVQCEGERFPVGQPWEAEYGEVAAPVEIADDPSASSGKHILQVDENGEGYALYRIVVPKSGEYQLKASVKSEEGSASSARISFDGNNASLWHLENLQAEWTWVFGPTVQLSSGVRELRILLEGTNTYIDKLELRARSTG
jgi:parallel beta-helix repeat protein